jgi:hypothetical protein
MKNNKPQRGQILNNILQLHQKGVPMTAKFMLEHGVSYELQRRYVKSGWFEKIAPGLLKRANDEVDWMGALSMLQREDDFKFHVAGRTALILKNKSQYLYFGNYSIFLSIPNKDFLTWFEDLFDRKLNSLPDIFSGQNLGIEHLNLGHDVIKISCQERAIMEMIYLANNVTLMEECSEQIDSLLSPNLNLIQELLEQCQSIKVKRFFLYLAERTHQSWIHDLDLTKVNLGRGKRSFDGGGILIKKYDLVLPERFVNSFEYLESEF